MAVGVTVVSVWVVSVLLAPLFRAGVPRGVGCCFCCCGTRGWAGVLTLTVSVFVFVFVTVDVTVDVVVAVALGHPHVGQAEDEEYADGLACLFATVVGVVAGQPADRVLSCLSAATSEICSTFGLTS